MTTVIGIMDRDCGPDQNTDVNVVVDPSTKTLTWVPRDLWVPGIRDRVNTAYRHHGGHIGYKRALAEIGFPVDHSLILWPRRTAVLLSSVDIVVPVTEHLHFWYPLNPWHPIERGRKAVWFNPPSERLSGERIHQWCGARSWAGDPKKPKNDLDRCRRQAVLLRRMIEDKYNFRAVVGMASQVDGVSLSAMMVLDDLAAVQSNWEFRVHDAVTPATIDGKWVYIPADPRADADV